MTTCHQHNSLLTWNHSRSGERSGTVNKLPCWDPSSVASSIKNRGAPGFDNQKTTDEVVKWYTNNDNYNSF